MTKPAQSRPDTGVSGARAAGDGKLTRTFEVSANASLTRRDARIFFIVTAAASLGIAGGLALQGLWLVFPFAGLELFVLGVAMGLTMRRGRYRELIRVSEDEVTIVREAGRPHETFVLPRHWAEVSLQRSPHAWHPSRLWIRSHGRSVEVGHMLTESERRGLTRRLAELIGPSCNSPALHAASDT